MRLNIGCGQHPLPYWTNLDSDPDAIADLYQRVPPIPFDDGTLDEIYAGHMLEHLDYSDATAFLADCYRALVPGGRLGIVVPDTKEIMRRYLAGTVDAVEYPYGVWWDLANLDAVCAMFLYSTVQGSRHQWMYDEQTLAKAMTRAGFKDLTPIDRYRDPRIAQGAWYQFGYDGRKP